MENLKTPKRKGILPKLTSILSYGGDSGDTSIIGTIIGFFTGNP
jgi:hypothetical protein